MKHFVLSFMSVFICNLCASYLNAASIAQFPEQKAISISITILVPGNYNSIQKAIDAANHGDKIVVSPGTYNENIQIKGKNIRLRSTKPKDLSIVNQTIISGHLNELPVIEFRGDEGTTCTLEGFTITKGCSGITGHGALANIQNNIILNNSNGRCFMQWDGGGIIGCSGLIQNNIIMDNYHSLPVGGYVYGAGVIRCSGIIQNNIIAFNIANSKSAYGAGLFACNGTISNNVIYGNKSQGGGGVYPYDAGGIYDCHGTIINCILWDNDSETSQVMKSSTPIYTCLQDWFGSGNGNISSEPLFVNPEGGDFYLMRESPCIDAGHPGMLYEDGCFPPGLKTRRNDMGAYGGLNNCGWLDILPITNGFLIQ